MHYSHKAFSKIIIGIVFIFSLSGCSSIVEPIKLPQLSPDPKLQENFSVKLVPLTFAAAKELNSEPFSRLVSLPSSSFSPKIVSEETIERKQFPPNNGITTYRLGVGDEVTLVQSMSQTPSLGLSNPNITSNPSTEEDRSVPYVNQVSPKSSINVTKGRVANDGSLFLIGIGRLEAKGRELIALQNEIRSILIRSGTPPNFKLEITGFNSQKAFITTDSPPDEKPDQIKYVLTITDQGTTLREILATAGIAFNEKFLTVVKIQRGGEVFSFSLADIFAQSAPEVYLMDKDHVFIKTLQYVKGKVFLVGGVKPKIIEIEPELRQTLAEVLFAGNGPLDEPTAQRSAVYLLRGRSPIKAFHLDAQNPARILVADAVEMRPNDIVYVAEQPINTFNRVLDTIFPLRIFSRDVKDNNLP